MTKKGPCDVAVFELVDRDFTSESSIGLVKDILGRNLDARLEVLAGEEKIESWRCNDDLWTSLN